jgi:hypothetical protein
VLQVVRKVSGPEVEKITGYWRKLRNEQHSCFELLTKCHLGVFKYHQMVGLVIFGDEQKCIQGFGGET